MYKLLAPERRNTKDCSVSGSKAKHILRCYYADKPHATKIWLRCRQHYVPIVAYSGRKANTVVPAARARRPARDRFFRTRSCPGALRVLHLRLL